MLKRLFFTIAFLLAALPVLAQQPGYFVAPDCGAVTGVANSTSCLQTTTVSGRTAGKIYLWNGAAWALSAAASFSELAGTASDAQVPDLNTLSTGLSNSKCVSTDGAGHLQSEAIGCATTGPTGPQGPPGGGAISIQYTFSTTTADADPGNGTLRLSNATQNAATVIRADLLDSGASDWTSVLDTLDASSSTVKGQVRLAKLSDQTKWLLFNLTARATPAGYRNFTVANIGSSSASPFADGDAIIFTFTRTGDQGSATGLGDPGGNGVVVRTGLGVTTNRTLTGTANEITLSNGDGVAGNPTISIASIVDLSGKTQTLPVKATTTAGAPGSCTANKELLIKTDATAGQQLFICNGTGNGWVLIGGGTGAASADVQIFTSTGANTWTKPASAKHVYVYLVGGGGGGASGRRGTTATSRDGGPGGGGAAASRGAWPASILGATETVNVGVGGTGGAVGSVDNTANSGTNGGNTNFGVWLRANGGALGSGVTMESPALGGVGELGGGNSGNGGDNGDNVSSAAGSQTLAGGGGGGGGGINAANAGAAGQPGGGGSSMRSTVISGGAGGSGGATCTAGGTPSNVATNEATGGAGGGGGGARQSGGVSCAGGAGALYGGGGGGGGASVNGQNSGAGGAGSQGIAIVVTVF